MWEGDWGGALVAVKVLKQTETNASTKTQEAMTSFVQEASSCAAHTTSRSMPPPLTRRRASVGGIPGLSL